MRRIDDFLIDRVFQPIADALADRVSCYGIAAFLFTGVGLGYAAEDLHYRDWAALLVMSPAIALVTRMAYRLDRYAPRNVLPANRMSWLFLRSLNLLTLPIEAIGEFLHPDIWRTLGHACSIVAATGFYFMACRKLPPRQRRATVPSRAAFAGSAS